MSRALYGADRSQALASTIGGIGIVLTIGRLVIHWNSGHAISRCADFLNAAAALVLVAFLVIQLQYLPLYDAVVLRGARQGPPVSLADRATFYRVEIASFMLFWIVLYLGKFSLLMLYRALFGVSKDFRAAWWGVFTLTVLAFFTDFLAVLWLCGFPGDPANVGTRAPRNSGPQALCCG